LADAGRKSRRRSRSRGRNRAQDEQQGTENQAEVQQPAAEPVNNDEQVSSKPVRSRSRRASRPQDAAAGDQPVLTGLALPASQAPATEPAVAAAAAPAASAAPQSSTKPKRRSRRATSVQGDANAAVEVVEVSAATGSVVQMDAASSQTEKPAEPAGAPVMFGVGVPVRELK
ncbi:MAG: ribonuclease E/G, partial [Glutamicibacter protophormiae]